MFVNNAIDSFDVIMHVFFCIDIINGPLWSSWAKSLFTVYQLFFFAT